MHETEMSNGFYTMQPVKAENVNVCEVSVNQITYF